MVNIFRQCLMAMVAGSLLTSCQPAVLPPPSNVPMRPIDHAMGTTQVPVSPQRVVVLDYAPLDTAFALDVIPVGKVEMIISPIYPEIFSTITVVGTGAQPDLETILRLNPDLILGSRPSVRKWYRQLSKIAPTVLTKDNGRTGNWQENFRLYADVLGQPDQAEQLLAAYQQRVDALQSTLKHSLETMTVSVITNWSGGVVAYSTDSFSGSVLQDLGFERNPYQGKGKRHGIRLSKEQLSAIDGDIIFLMHQATDDDSVAKVEFVK